MQEYKWMVMMNEAGGPESCMVEVKVINGKVAEVGTADDAASRSHISTLPVHIYVTVLKGGTKVIEENKI